MMFQGKALTVSLQPDGIAELTFDLQGESVNKFSLLVVSELQQVLDLLEKAKDVRGLLVKSAKDVFIVGADIMEFGAVFAEGPEKITGHLATNNQNFCRLEDLPFPTVVAINGFALGGGLEFCLACDYRVASTAAKVGLPETKLGIIPGWGGTVRLPRVAGLDTAVEWIAAGKENDAATALTARVIDAVVEPEKLRDAALHCLQQCISGKFDYQARRAQKKAPLKLNFIESMMAFETSKAFVGGQAGRNYPAPVSAIKAMQKAADKGRDEALQAEAENFAKMAQTPVAQSLVGIFVNEQFLSKKAKGWEKKADKKVGRAAVLGAGIMGGGIAYQSALKSVPIKMKDIAQKGIDLGLAEANKLLSKRVERKKLTASEMGDVLNRIEPALTYDGFDQVDIVVEAVVENPKVKKAVLAEVESKVNSDTVLASNTSTISITYLAEGLARPENFCGMHFFNPVHMMPLVEVIRGEKTSDNAIARTVAYANAMGKKPIVVKDCPGFLVNRVLFPYLAGFAMLVRDGVDFQRIDKLMETWGWPMGPAYLLDVVGIDTAVHAEKVMANGFPDRMQRDFTSCTDALFAAGRLGQKNEKGFYNYELDKKGKPAKVAAAEVADILKPTIQGAIEISDEDIIARMMIPMVTELTRCLDEGIVETASEADMALVYGTGFPPFRGGVFRWVDFIGAQTFCDMAAKFAALGALYQAPDSLKAKAANNQKFYG
ncbi:fatty acid oxidation complex subunit alpha FadB [Cellvibrio sp. NN19]|uniref:fatty acid oxidation complex subunit alpha FadB n=1 Tax=Cellvibrio chitinivorans TaxID=3102792 RepID=UPI002B401897|nr:fatty acid oxidation complex subunit alpha FadB [Cellvibrio sp. NN19]